MPHIGSGAVIRLGPPASPQFVQPILFRVIRRQDWEPTADGWVWLDGYQLDEDGNAVERRSVFVQVAGVAVLAGAG